MRLELPRRGLCAAMACIAFVSGCAVSPQSDGGIVGTGNRIDCEALRGEASRTPLPDECKPQKTERTGK
jgi:hypothetical protein